MQTLTPIPRPRCPRCRRPLAFCWCRRIQAVPTRTRLVFLQHHRESRVPINTARIAHLALENSEFHVGVSFPFAPGPRTAVLFPGEEALEPAILREGEPWTLIVVDGTWSQARKLVRHDPLLRDLPRIGFQPERPGNYRIRKEPSAECLATVEAVAEVLGQVEGSRERFQPMIDAFTHMVDLQIAATREAGGIVRRRQRRGPKPVDPQLELLRTAGARLVLVQAEGNSHPRDATVPGRPELVHLVALRPATGERFEAVVAPRRPLAEAAPRHMELDRSTILQGEEVERSLARFRAFLREGDVIGTWRSYPLDLLEAEGLRLQEPIDLRLVLARKLGRRPGALEAFHGPLPEGSLGRGRAGRTLASLEALVSLLVEEAPRARISSP